MKKIMTTLGVAFIFSTALAQSTKLTPPDTRPAKDNHGGTVSTAAHQTYAKSEKGKFISLIARLKSRKNDAKDQSDVPSKRLSTSKPNHQKAKGLSINHPKQPAQPNRRGLSQRANTNGRSERLNRPNPGRRSVGNGRFSLTRRG